MSTPDPSYSVSVQMGVISSNLNATILSNFLFGIYTVIYAGTMYLYLLKNTAGVNRRIVLLAISVLYLLCFLTFLLQWYLIDWALVLNGSRRESIFIASVESGPPWTLPLSDVLFYFSFIISDVLLIWRCYHVWGQSIRVVSIPSALLFVEFSLFVSVIVLAATFSFITSSAKAKLFNSVASALIFVSVGTTLTTTFLIGYRIHATSHLGSPSRKLYNHIAILVIETAAVYSLLLLFDALFIVIPGSASMNNRWALAGEYLGDVSSIAAGLVPTVLVARLALVNPNTTDSTIIHMSGLQSVSQHEGGRSGIATDIVHTATQTENTAPAFGREEKKSAVVGTRAES